MRSLSIAGLLVPLVLPLTAACGRDEAASGAAPAASPAAVPAAGGAESASALLRDDFSDPASGWTVRDRGDYRNEYADGRYVLRVDNARSPYVSNVAYREGELGDVRIEVDATRLAGAPSAGVGIDCRRAGADGAGTYYGDVDAEGNARIVAHGEEQEVLVEIERQGLWRDGANRLRLDCVGDELSLWLNGERLLSTHDDRYRRGRIGLRAGGGSDEPTEVAFDDLLVTAPGAGS